MSLKKFSTSNFFIWSEFLGVGGDENLIINFLCPKFEGKEFSETHAYAAKVDQAAQHRAIDKNGVQELYWYTKLGTK